MRGDTKDLPLYVECNLSVAFRLQSFSRSYTRRNSQMVHCCGKFGATEALKLRSRMEFDSSSTTLTRTCFATVPTQQWRTRACARFGDMQLVRYVQQVNTINACSLLMKVTISNVNIT